MTSFLAKMEVLDWLRQGRKTIDIRKGNPRSGDVAIFISGPHKLKLRIVHKQSGRLVDLIRQDNYLQVIPTASDLDDAVNYLRKIYGSYDDVFTAYTVVP